MVKDLNQLQNITVHKYPVKAHVIISIYISDVLPEFANIDQSNPNCVVLGDALETFSYQNLNKAFRLLKSLDNPILFSLGKGYVYFIEV